MFFRSIAWKLIGLLVLAAILPLTVFGAISVWQARNTAKEAVLQGNMRVAERAADQIYQYIENSIAILHSTAENVSRVDLKPWQRERVIRNMALEFSEFSEIVLAGTGGRIEATSSVGASRIMASPYGGEAVQSAISGREYYSPVFITDEFVPAMIVSLPMQTLGDVTGAALAEVDLINMWRLADRIRIGKEGYLSVVTPSGRLIASGSGEMKRRVFQEQDYPDVAMLRKLTADSSNSAAIAERSGKNGDILVAAAVLPEPFSWTVVMEQPTAEAFALARKLTLILSGLIVAFVAAMGLLGYFGARWQIVKPVMGLIGGTRRIAAGDLSCRVEIKSRDELGELATSFNRMAGELSLMQENIRKQERMAFFGRIASGLAHDLRHPIRSIENASRLMEQMYEDAEYRKTFRRVVEREFSKINAFLENLKTLSHDIPYHPIELALNALLDEVVDTFAMDAQSQSIAIEKEYAKDDIKIYADKFSMTRALSNLVNNAIQAMQSGGRLTIKTYAAAGADARGRTAVSIADTGCGIPPDRQETVFSDFVTTKRHGLGLGLALVKRVVDQHGAEIKLASEVGRGTTFEILFSAASRAPDLG